MRVDEVPVLGVVLHTRADATPHRLVHGGVDAITLRTQGGEIDVTACVRVACGEDVIVHRALVEVGVAGIMCVVEEGLGEFQHIVAVA